MKKYVNGILVDLTPEEIAELEAARAEAEAKRPMREWQERIRQADMEVSRLLEDVIDALDAPTRARIAQASMDRVNRKKQIRRERPND